MILQEALLAVGGEWASGTMGILRHKSPSFRSLGRWIGRPHRFDYRGVDTNPGIIFLQIKI
ncbi:hypothetical protein TRIP_B50004 [uncultured Desulfatiglans sp.]|nr:hypothetical protein TRIP_B50004 [uncultured Desulfatiglans sp.]